SARSWPEGDHRRRGARGRASRGGRRAHRPPRDRRAATIVRERPGRARRAPFDRPDAARRARRVRRRRQREERGRAGRPHPQPVSDLVELLQGLVEIDSINPDLIAGAAGEAELARHVAGWAERAGLEVEVEEAAPGRPNVIATARGSGGGRTLLLNAHMDTVGIDTMDSPFDARVEDGRLYGRGSYDMKGSLAAILLVATEAKRRGLRG